MLRSILVSMLILCTVASAVEFFLIEMSNYSNFPPLEDVERLSAKVVESIDSTISIVKNPTFSELKDTLSERILPTEDVIVIFLGRIASKDSRIYLLPSDAGNSENTWISLEDVSRGKNILWIIMTPEEVNLENPKFGGRSAVIVGNISEEFVDLLAGTFKSIHDNAGLVDIYAIVRRFMGDFKVIEGSEFGKDRILAYLKIHSKNDVASNARVYLDGAYRGKIENGMFVSEVSPGRHRVRISSEYIEDVVFEFDVGIYEDREIEIDVKRASGVVELITKPIGATVYVDGELIGKTPKFVKLEVGKNHRIELLKSGYLPKEIDLSLERKNQIKKMFFELEKLPENPPEIVWQRVLGGVGFGELYHLERTRDGFIAVGTTHANLKGYHGDYDALVVKFDNRGNVIWKKVIGGKFYDAAYGVVVDPEDGGYTVIGYTDSSDGDIPENRGEFDAWVFRLSKGGDLLWSKTFGGSGDDEVYDIARSPDGGYVIVGYTDSIDGDVHENKGEYDAWIFKISNDGKLIWSKTFGGGYRDSIQGIAASPNRGYMIAGYTRSIHEGNENIQDIQGDVWIAKVEENGSLEWGKILGGNQDDGSYDIARLSNGEYVILGYLESVEISLDENRGWNDTWLIGMNEDGSVVWEKTLDGDYDDESHGVVRTPDGGFLVVGHTSSGEVGIYRGGWDVKIFKLSGDGNILWDRELGGSDWESANGVVSCWDGYAVLGWTWSTDGDLEGRNSDDMEDAWIIGVDDEGRILSNNVIGGSGFEELKAAVRSPDGGCVAVGYTSSSDIDGEYNRGGYDALVVKFNERGDITWIRVFGGEDEDEAYDIVRSKDGGYVIVGHTASYGGDIHENHGEYDGWVFKISDGGEMLWSKTFGGSGWDFVTGLISLKSGGYLVVGYTDSKDGDIEGWHESYDSMGNPNPDVWIFKLDENGDLIWSRVIGGTDLDEADDVAPSPDGEGCVVIGHSYSKDGDVGENRGGMDIWIVGLNGSGDIIWSEILGGSHDEEAYSIVYTDVGYVIAGYTDSNDGDVRDYRGYRDAWILKLGWKR